MKTYINQEITIKHLDITNDDINGYEAYEIPINIEAFLTHVIEVSSPIKSIVPKILLTQISRGFETIGQAQVFNSSYKSLLDDNYYSTRYETWIDNSNQEETHKIPMMSVAYVFPDYVKYNPALPLLTKGNTTLIYDNENECYLLCLTGGGMDLTPDLLASFISIGHGVPLNIATNTTLNYSASISEPEHQENCQALAQALKDFADSCNMRANNLTVNNQ